MDEVKSYYTSKYGAPSRQAKFLSPDGKEITIYKWVPEQTNEGVTIYATLGAGSQLGDKSERCEFFIGLTPEVDDIAEALAQVALNGIGNSEIPKSGDSIAMSYSLWGGTDAKNFLFTNGDEIIPPLILKDKAVSFIQLVPLFDSELAFKKDKGESMLWQVFETKQVPYWNSRRQSAF